MPTTVTQVFLHIYDQNGPEFQNNTWSWEAHMMSETLTLKKKKGPKDETLKTSNIKKQ